MRSLLKSRHVKSLRKIVGKKIPYCYRCIATETRTNHVSIQMLSKELHSQIFKDSIPQEPSVEQMLKVQKHLTKHGLWDKTPSKTDSIAFDLPPLLGKNVDEHFVQIGKELTSRYFALAEHMSNSITRIPPKPKKWHYVPGWTMYKVDGTVEQVEIPDEDVLVFDVEICMNAGSVPILATAVSKRAWYCWVSEYLTNEHRKIPRDISPNSMINVCGNDLSRERLLIGHNVGFDRTFVKEAYHLKDHGLRFLDTMSLHVCISGVTTEQRNYMNQKNPASFYEWMKHGSTNSLAKVYEFYCNKTLDKSTRDLFVVGTLDDIRENFQACADYCASDVESTQEVFQMIWPEFLHHVPHPVSFCGMLEMGDSYLPITRSWKEYINHAESMYMKVTNEMKESLMTAAEDVLKLLKDQKYKGNLWTWNMDWSLHKSAIPPDEKLYDDPHDGGDIHRYIRNNIEHLSEKRLAQLHMPGYPKWYRDLCVRTKGEQLNARPANISTQTQVTPYILRMTWDGYPLHYQQQHGWGYLAPVKSQLHHLNKAFVEYLQDKKEFVEKELEEQESGNSSTHTDTGGLDIGLPGIRFHRLPHKDGDDYNVGNPLAKDFLSKIDDGTLSTSGSYNAKLPIEMNKMISFWRNGRKRVGTQLSVWLDDNKESGLGVILPQVVTAGTVTRRAVERTWLTASNPLPDRIGSELKSLVRAPPGYSLVGADVDSQELWIASILGDAQFAQIHGCSALSWMTLQGKKSERTDLHSKTADTIGMSRDQAKIFNYGRVYGAGEPFAKRLLLQFNHKLSIREAEKTAAKLYASTKGVKRYRLNKRGKKLAEELNVPIENGSLVTSDGIKRLMREHHISWKSRYHLIDENYVWYGGSESDMFNKLESIALSDQPKTPVLGCLVTKALLPKHVENRYKTSRVNWVVQSSAVDYLHLMLTCMKWLIRKYNINARFCVSIHDEVRYIVSERDENRLALALQITNLLTRSMFAYKLNLNDLPQSVAFFSCVDIDKVLRKEVDMDCVTPSNPNGLEKGHGIPHGKSMDIYELLKLTNGGRFD